MRAFVSYAAACRPEYISLSGELSAIKVRKSDRFAKVDYMTEKAVEALSSILWGYSSRDSLDLLSEVFPQTENET